jgi:hypothetical protein
MKPTYTTNSPISFPYPSITFNNSNLAVLRITSEGRMIIGEGLSTDEATQVAAKMLVDAFEQEIQKMVDARIATMKEGEAKGYLERAQKAEAQLHALTLICGTSDANKFQSWVDREREKVRVLRDALERRHTEQGYHRQYVDDVLDATKEASK